ncbi:MAG: hypothetical protein JO097_09755 [Acidobacteriaceae bacterium]|nr:hypothetical protein [Acidobacteriaceae bacterium]MBV9764715.1 hypothetical protein [Acidobacteriaceae bacterium]
MIPQPLAKQRNSFEIPVLLNGRFGVEMQKRMPRQFVFLKSIVLTSLALTSTAIAASTWQKDDPSQWTTEDVYQILNNSPWSKSVRVTTARAAGYGDQNGGVGGDGGTWGEGMPGGMGRSGGMGRGGMGGGMGRRRGGYPSGQEDTTATVQWASALPVRLAEAKSAGTPADPAAMKPLDEYVIAVIGLPKSGFEPHGSTGNSDDDPADARLADHLKVITVLSVGHERLNPTKIELNQGRDGRAIFHFEKSEPVSLRDKDAEFRITGDRAELRKKFALKDMEYQGKLEL